MVKSPSTKRKNSHDLKWSKAQAQRGRIHMTYLKQIGREPSHNGKKYVSVGDAPYRTYFLQRNEATLRKSTRKRSAVSLTPLRCLTFPSSTAKRLKFWWSMVISSWTGRVPQLAIFFSFRRRSPFFAYWNNVRRSPPEYSIIIMVP